MTLITLKNWSLIPGPLANPPKSSSALDDIVLYPPHVVANALIAVPGMRVKHAAEPSWGDLVLRWSEGDRWIEIGFTAFDGDPPAWGGSGLNGECDLADILEVWEAIRSMIPACWMHDMNCDIHSPESFANAVRT
jgi:hypothetical protein